MANRLCLMVSGCMCQPREAVMLDIILQGFLLTLLADNTGLSPIHPLFGG